jgi:hypothetical protein
MRFRVVAVRHRGQKWRSRYHLSLTRALGQAERWRERYPELLSLGIEDENGKEIAIPPAADE